MQAARRLLKEYRDILKSEIVGVKLKPRSEDDLTEWDAWLAGPNDSLYEGGVFQLHITVPANYPSSPPKFRFVTKVCHPNVHFKTGEICLDVLASKWSPAWSLESACLAVQVLLTEPDESSPLNCDAGNLLRCRDQRGYASLIRMYTQLYASEH